MKSTPQKIELKSFEDLQKLQEKYDIPFAASITQVMIQLICVMAMKDVPSVTIILTDAIMPDAYKYNTCIWAKHFHDKVPYTNVISYRPRGKKHICIYAGMTAYQPNFYRTLKTQLVESDVISYTLDKVPKAYQTNPYILVHRLRTLGVETKATLTKDRLTISRK